LLKIKVSSIPMSEMVFYTSKCQRCGAAVLISDSAFTSLSCEVCSAQLIEITNIISNDKMKIKFYNGFYSRIKEKN